MTGHRARLAGSALLIVCLSILMFLVLPELSGARLVDFEIYGLFGVLGLGFAIWGLIRLVRAAEDPIQSAVDSSR